MKQHPRQNIFYFLRNNDLDNLEEYLKSGDSLDISEYGTTPLIYCVVFEKKTALEWLLENGANPFIKDDSGRTAYEYAVSMNKKTIAEILEKIMNNPKPEYPKAVNY